MAMRRREFRDYAQARWPLLRAVMVGHFHQDFTFEHGSVDGAIIAATREGSIEQRKTVIQELLDWNTTEGAKDDIRPFLREGFGVAVFFRKPIDGRNFMNRIHDELVAGVRADTGKQ